MIKVRKESDGHIYAYAAFTYTGIIIYNINNIRKPIIINVIQVNN